MIIDQDNIQFKPNNNYKEEKLFLAMGHRYLYWAAVIGREDLVCSLMSFNLSPFTRSYKGRNAVHAATYQGNLNLLKIFFDNDISKRHVFQLGGITTAVNMMTE
jgi:ankyrin repeat protein